LENFNNDVRIYYPILSKQLNFTDRNFEKKEFTEPDLEFLNHISKEFQDFEEIHQKLKLEINQCVVERNEIVIL
jgi:hypothetical protein